ncbi:hypothetical protein KCP75_16565 [Salmonella enterica subsp. enterica]|nr:hypothetical protein KCP75_16565 [Salmonella enterica subsp. enterica]
MLHCVNPATIPKDRRMSETFSGFDTAPVARVQAAFEEITHRSMHDLSFLHRLCRCMSPDCRWKDNGRAR